MSSNSKRKSLKHKLSDALEAANAGKKAKLSPAKCAAVSVDDSGFGSSSKETALKTDMKRAPRSTAKRKLASGASKSTPKRNESQDSGIGSEPILAKPRTPKSKRHPAAPKSAPDVDAMDISAILALGEGIPATNNDSREEHMSDSDDSDFEEVTDTQKEPVIPENGVNITLEAPIVSFKRKKRETDLEGEIRRQLKRRQKEIQELMHKVHLVCWIAHLKFVNGILNSSETLEECHEILNAKSFYPPKHADLGYLERIIKTFNKHISYKENAKEELEGGLQQALTDQFQKKSACSKNMLNFMFVVFLRSVGVKARIVMSFVPVPLKPSVKGTLSDCGKPKTSKNNTSEGNIKIKSEVKVKNETPVKSKSRSSQKTITRIQGSKKTVKKEEESPKKSLKTNVERNLRSPIAGSSKTTTERIKTEELSDESDESEPLKFAKARVRKTKKNAKSTKARSKEEILDDSDDEESNYFKSPVAPKKSARSKKSEANDKSKDNVPDCKPGKPRKAPAKPKKALKEDDDCDGEESKHFKPGKVVRKPLKSAVKKAPVDENSDEEFHPEKKGSVNQIDRRVLSSSEEDPVADKKKGQDVWVEVFLEDEEKWISVDIVRQKVHCVQFLYNRATQPVTYVVACNNDSTMKDVTQRYVPHWHSDTRKKRVADEWWKETLWPYLPPPTPMDKEEDEDIAKQLHDMPLPTSISEYKAHPLYALKRHLLKFEGIYPVDAPTLGFVRGEPVYGRECVVTLRSREIWFKEARVVRLNETPYKVVKSRPKYDKMTGDWKKDLPLELFGVWQTEDYIPPTAVDGKVPRNEYGNVDLFKPCMLPFGTVHLQIPALIRVARKLNIDCAPAVVGFEFHSGGSHPVHDGFVVCEEFKDQLLDAWNKDIDESAKRAEEKREKRVYGNWRRLIRGLVIRENLKMKYAFGENEEEAAPSTSAPEAAPPPKKKRFRHVKP